MAAMTFYNAKLRRRDNAIPWRSEKMGIYGSLATGRHCY